MTVEDPSSDGLVRAAGGVVWRHGNEGTVEVLLVHRPRYDDWTFPKGKLDPGESWEQAALREVLEETGVVAHLGPELASTAYRDRHDRRKSVRYWSMTVADSSPFQANDEVSDVRWVPVEEAAGSLTYDRDLSVLRSFTTASPGSTGS